MKIVVIKKDKGKVEIQSDSKIEVLEGDGIICFNYITSAVNAMRITWGYADFIKDDIQSISFEGW